MNYSVKEFELELNSKDFPKLSFQQFQHLVEEQTKTFVQSMIQLNTQFVSLQDLSPLGCTTAFFPVAGCLAVRRIYQFDAPSKNHFVRLEANALVQVNEVDQLLPGETPLTVMNASEYTQLGLKN